MKTNKRKIRKYLKYVKEFSRRFDLAIGKYLSIFLGVFERIVKVTHFAQVISLISQYITSKRIYDWEIFDITVLEVSQTTKEKESCMK